MSIRWWLLPRAAAGAVAGGLTGVLRIWLSVPLLLSGIVTSTALYSIILYLMHGGDLSLASQRTLVSFADDIGSQLAGGSGDLVLFGTSVSARNWMGLLLTFAVVAGVAVLLNVFFRTNLGLSLRATGNNRMMARAQGIDVGLSLSWRCLSNGLIGLSGAIFAQFIGFVNVTLGAGILATGLASLMIGEVCSAGAASGDRFRQRSPGRWCSAFWSRRTPHGARPQRPQAADGPACWRDSHSPGHPRLVPLAAYLEGAGSDAALEPRCMAHFSAGTTNEVKALRVI